MSTAIDPHDQVMTPTWRQLREILLELARQEDEIALAEAAAVPYWAPHPPSVLGHRVAARALRTEADCFLQGSRVGVDR